MADPNNWDVQHSVEVALPDLDSPTYSLATFNVTANGTTTFPYKEKIM